MLLTPAWYSDASPSAARMRVSSPSSRVRSRMRRMKKLLPDPQSPNSPIDSGGCVLV